MELGALGGRPCIARRPACTVLPETVDRLEPRFREMGVPGEGSSACNSEPE